MAFPRSVPVSKLGPSVVLTGMLGLGACAVPQPTTPNVMVLPSPGKNFAQFQQEDGYCRQYASQQIGYGSPSQAATQSGVGSAVVGTGLGAAAGAALGAVGGNAGIGAALGAGTGLLFGSAIGANNAQASAAGVQQRYDTAYVQCMTADGNQLAQAPAAGYAPVAVGYPAYGPAPAYAYYPPVVYGGGVVVIGGGRRWH